MAHCTTHPHTCELQSWTVVTSVWRFMPNPKSMDICDRVGSIFIVYLYLRLLCSLPLPSTTCHVTSLVALNLRPLGLEKTDIMAKHLLKGRGHNNHTFEQAMTLLCKRTRFWKVCVATSLEALPLSSMQFKVYRAHLWLKYDPLALTKQIVLGKPRTNRIVPFASTCAPPIYTGTKVLFSRARKKLSPTWGIMEELWTAWPDLRTVEDRRDIDHSELCSVKV